MNDPQFNARDLREAITRQCLPVTAWPSQGEQKEYWKTVEPAPDEQHDADLNENTSFLVEE